MESAAELRVLARVERDPRKRVRPLAIANVRDGMPVAERYQSGEVDRSGRISKVGDDRARTMLYEAANTMLSRSTR